MNKIKLNKDIKNISEMFDDIAPKYDFLNHFFTANLDKRWRKKIIKTIENENYNKISVLDLASGTGDMTIELLKLNPEVVYSFDISEKMLEIQKQKIKNKNIIIAVADSENLPVESNSIDIVTIAFGVRNFENLDKSLKEINRVLKPNGVLIILEMFNLEKRNKLFEFYFTKIMPVLGKGISRSNFAYDYLHTSVLNFKTVTEFINLSSNYNFKNILKVNNFLNFVFTIYLQKI